MCDSDSEYIAGEALAQTDLNFVQEPRSFRTSTDHPQLNIVIELLSQRWTLTILNCMLEGHDRFNAMSRDQGINPNTLRTRLRDLEELGLVSRDVENLIPPKVKYGLTQSGREFARIMEALLEWSNRNNISPARAVVSTEYSEPLTPSDNPIDFDSVRESEPIIEP